MLAAATEVGCKIEKKMAFSYDEEVSPRWVITYFLYRCFAAAGVWIGLVLFQPGKSKYTVLNQHLLSLYSTATQKNCVGPWRWLSPPTPLFCVSENVGI